MERIVGTKYRLKKRIGGGSFGEIYIGENTCTHRRVAVKLEKAHSRVPQLSFESKLYKYLQGGTGIPNIHYYGSEALNNVMVIDLLGKSLEDLFIQCNRKFSLKTVLMLADQMLTCIEYVHNKNFIHRDMKPDNFVMGLSSNSNQVYIIDFGLAKKYRDSNTHQHIRYSDGKSLTGTARYASVAALKGCEQSRRDDLEALGYVWIYLLKGSLPWMGLKGIDKKQKYEKIGDIKSKTKFEDLCRGLPKEFVYYFNSVRNLQFHEQPRYSMLRRLFRDLFIKEGYVWDYEYDWNIPPSPQLSKRPVTTKVSIREDNNETNLMTNDMNETFHHTTPQLNLAKRPLTTHRSSLRTKSGNVFNENSTSLFSVYNPRKQKTLFPSISNELFVICDKSGTTPLANHRLLKNDQMNRSKRERVHPLFDNKRFIVPPIKDLKPQTTYGTRRIPVA